jgi:Rrf2 family nitric oxide-sensitive transcriptional repressor
MISQTVEYSLRAVLVLASQYDKAMTVREMAEVARIPAPYLSKIMKGLVRAEIVQSRRGLGGGFKLARNPTDITIWDVTQAIDPLERIRTCPLGIEGHAVLCPLHRRIDRAIEQIETAFRASTLDEILNESSDSKPLCEENPVLQIATLKQGKPTKKGKSSKGASKKRKPKKK